MRIGPVITVYAAILLLVVIFGTAFSYALGATNFNIPISNPLTALYFTIITISTVGYGDIYPVTAVGRIFTMILVLAGISTFIGAVTAISSDFMSKNVAKLSGRISGLERRTLSRHHVLIGTDFINQDIADKFRRERENFIILSADKTTADRYVDDGLRAFVADPTSETDMRKFEMHRARSIIIDLNENSLTVYALLIVRKLAPNVLTIVVAQNSEIAERVSDLGLKKNERVINVSSHLAGEIVRSLK
ncbi:MAG: ion channel [Candidatus Marsarchaeota archaeon]|nr:ion channel [Candidatus Marsarchaeota archaeon]